MKRRIISIVLALSLLVMGPAALAEKTYQSHTSVTGASSAQLENILLAAEAIDGVEVPHGERFSFNEVVGPRTRARGYVRAENGRGVKVTGGGVAQAATTLYLALLDVPEDIEFDEISTYGARFTGDYVSDGDLAVITDYNGGADLAFTNEGGDMELEMWVNGGKLYCVVRVDEDKWFEDKDDGRTLSARIPWGDDDDVLNNVQLAAESVYDTALGEDDVFSFNSVVGPRTSKYGYVSATNGRGKRVTGGGVAQVASVIWLAIKDDDDFEILEKSTYGRKYNQDYVEDEDDAILTDYSNGTDFSFRYTGEGTATLYTFVEGDELRCNIAITD